MLDFDLVADAWSLGNLIPSVDSDAFRAGERLDAPADLRMPITTPGRALDITVLDYVIVVSSSVGELVAELAANDVQRVPVRIDGVDGSYELLHVLSRIDCLDYENTRADARGPNGWEAGTLASLAHLLVHPQIYSYVMTKAVTLRTTGIDGPRIFRVPRWDLWPVITEELKRALELEHVTGARFRAIRTTP